MVLLSRCGEGVAVLKLPVVVAAVVELTVVPCSCSQMCHWYSGVQVCGWEQCCCHKHTTLTSRLEIFSYNTKQRCSFNRKMCWHHNMECTTQPVFAYYSSTVIFGNLCYIIILFTFFMFNYVVGLRLVRVKPRVNLPSIHSIPEIDNKIIRALSTSAKRKYRELYFLLMLCLDFIESRVFGFH